MTRILQLLIAGCLMIGLTSCGHKTPVDVPVVTPSLEASAPLPPMPPAPAPTPTPVQTPAPASHKIGILLPLSGDHAALGKGLLEAAELALFEAGSSSITLLPQDTAQGADKAAQKALNEGAELLIGPIFAADVEKIKPQLTARGVNLLCFSTDQAVAGQGVYVLGVLPAQQIERVMAYAKERGITKIAALTPNDQYGGLVDQTLRRLEAQGSVHLLGIIHYTKNDLQTENPSILTEVEAYKSQGCEALFIPEGGENLALLVHLLGNQDSLKILGSGQWDTPETQSIPGLAGGIFASTSPEGRQSFETRFRNAYGHAPERITSLAYDATALAIALADKGYTSQNLTFSQGFAGTEGLFRLTPQGMNERGLAVFEVHPSGFKQVSPARETF